MRISDCSSDVCSSDLAEVLTLAFAIVAVEVEVQRLIFVNRQGVVQVEVFLLEVVIHIRSSHASYEVVGELVGCAGNVGGGQARVDTAGNVDAIATHANLIAQGGEATCAQFQALDFVAGDQGAGGNFRHNTAVVGGEHWAAGELVTVFQDGIGQTEFNCTASLRLRDRKSDV